MALTLNTREAGEFGGAHEWLGSLSGLCWIFPGAEKEHEENKDQVLAPEKILTVRVLKGKAADILQVSFHIRSFARNFKILEFIFILMDLSLTH